MKDSFCFSLYIELNFFSYFAVVTCYSCFFVSHLAGIVGLVLLVLICILVFLLLWCLSRQKGSYVTNEMDDEDDFDVEDGISVTSDTALQSSEPLKVKEEE